jgi:hypothetical protein
LSIKTFCLVGASNIRTGGHTEEPKRLGLYLVSLKNVGRYILYQGMMVFGRTEILAYGDQVTPYLSEIPHKTADFLTFFP